MTKREKARGKLFSLKTAMAVTLSIGLLLAVVTYFLVEIVGTSVIDNVYLAEEHKEEREKYYAAALQDYVTVNSLTGEDNAAFAAWAKSNRYVYLMVYKDDQLFFDSGSVDEPQTPQPPSGEGGGSGSDEGTPNQGGEGAEGIGSGTGITVRFPTREELMEYADANDAHIINTADDKVLVVNMADFTEYLYYDIVNITSIVTAVIVLFITIMLHFHGVTARISRLAKSVGMVAEGDMHHSVGIEGQDEIAGLSRNVENMRSAILENIENERAIMDANAELITSMSHDIRTPLTVLLGYLGIMKERAGDDAVMAEYVGASEKTALRLKKLSDDLFAYFLLFGTGAADINKEEYEVRMLFDQMLSEHVLLLREQGYLVEFDISEPSAKISTDPSQLMRVFENLVSNILKYADKSHPVSIIIDVGKDKFTLRLKNRIKENRDFAESNGIGLKTCHKIAETLGIEFKTTEGEEYFEVEMTFDTLTAPEADIDGDD